MILLFNYYNSVMCVLLSHFAHEGNLWKNDEMTPPSLTSQHMHTEAWNLLLTPNHTLCQLGHATVSKCFKWNPILSDGNLNLHSEIDVASC